MIPFSAETKQGREEIWKLIDEFVLEEIAEEDVLSLDNRELQGDNIVSDDFSTINKEKTVAECLFLCYTIRT